MASRLARRQLRQLYNLRLRARQRGLPADLYLLAWQETLEDFQGRCAYCDSDAAFTIDHFQPMALDGPTSIENCLPCCQFCNQLKGARPPEQVFHVPKERIEQLQLYLKRRGTGVRGWPPPRVRSEHTASITFNKKKEKCMTVQETHRSKISLPHGREAIIFTTPSQVVLHLQQHKVSDDDLLSPVVNVAAALTPQECFALSSELLRAASSLLEKTEVPNLNSLSNYSLEMQ